MNESLVKYLAGLLDADGSLGFFFKRDENREGRYFVGLRLMLSSSETVDRDGFVASLPQKTGMGSTSFYTLRHGAKCAIWTVNKRADVEMLVPRLIKHMVIKAQHWQWLLEMWRTTRAENKAVTLDERERLTTASKESRKLRVGPMHPKNHPTWAWLAGYLDGDGCYSYRKYRNGPHQQWTINVSAVAHINDVSVLEFLQRSFGGRIEGQGQSENVKVWVRSLGYQNRSFAENFLPHLAKHSRLKRHKIDAIIHHHRQRLSVPGTKPKGLVQATV